MKHLTLFIFIIFALLLIAGCINNNYNNQENTVKTSSCNELEKKIKDLIDNANYCSENSDCIAIDLVHCTPLGSYGLINKNADIGDIKRYTNEYSAKCPKEICKPILSPKLKEIKCENNKCIDIRFSE